jgi:hypothetical protein
LEYQPPFIPVKLVIAADGTVSVVGEAKIVTAIGTFAANTTFVETKIQEELEESGTTILIIRTRQADGELLENIYKLSAEEVVAVLDGQTTVTVANRRIMIDASGGQVSSVLLRPRVEAPDDARPVLDGDLGVSVRMTDVSCDGDYGVFVAAAVQPNSYADEVQRYLDQFPGAGYMLTEQNCSSLRHRMPDGSQIYSVYYGPYSSLADACEKRAQAGGRSYVRRLDDVTPVGQDAQC